MIPAALPAVVLALAAFRITRLAAWDDLPPLVRFRAWVLGETTITRGSTNARLRQTGEAVAVEHTYRRPLLAHGLSCAFCSGLWWSVGVYVAWRLEPSWTLAACFPLAVSTVVGLAARNLDP